VLYSPSVSLRLLLPVVLTLSSGCALITTRGDARRMSALIDAAKLAGMELPDPLAISPAVTESVLQHVGRQGTELERVKRLHRWLRDQSGLGFRYDALHTRGAQDAWEARSGDCLSYAHLFAALARFLQVPMNYVRYREAQTYEERDGQFLVVSHVATIYNDYRVTILVELTGDSPSSRVSDYEVLGDDEAAALHYSNLAMEQLAKGDNEGPEKLLRLLLKRTPGLPEIQNNLGAVLLRAGKPQEALVVLKPALKKFPDFVPLYVNGALAARGSGDGPLSEELAEKARSSWTDPFLPFVRGTWLLDRGKPAEAVQLLERAVSLKPKSAMFHAWLSKALLELKRVEDAKREYYEAVRLAPTNPMVRDLAPTFAEPGPTSTQ
jgi:tetratricopeptide (TPR) repeat protein